VTGFVSVVGLSAVTFVSTSFDNFMLLLGFFADDEYPRRQVVSGYLVAVVVVVLGAWAASAALEQAPASYLGYLGLIPLGLGLVGLYRLVRFAGPAVTAAEPTSTKGFIPVTLVMLANSGDSLSVYVSVFADTSEALEVPIVGTAAVFALVYAALARWLATRSGLAGPIQRAARVLLPFLLIAIGTYILLDTATDAAR
jgi:cadmium resistance protein CadD (predicted permease)